MAWELEDSTLEDSALEDSTLEDKPVAWDELEAVPQEARPRSNALRNKSFAFMFPPYSMSFFFASLIASVKATEGDFVPVKT